MAFILYKTSILCLNSESDSKTLYLRSVSSNFSVSSLSFWDGWSHDNGTETPYDLIKLPKDAVDVKLLIIFSLDWFIFTFFFYLRIKTMKFRTKIKIIKTE